MQVVSKLCLPVAPHVAFCIHLGTDFAYCLVFMQKIFLQILTWIKAGGSSDSQVHDASCGRQQINAVPPGTFISILEIPDLSVSWLGGL